LCTQGIDAIQLLVVTFLFFQIISALLELPTVETKDASWVPELADRLGGGALGFFT
jgi:hypothetical protein